MRALLIAVELFVLSVLILAARCWNHDRVFVGHDVYFTDADCYSRMSRVSLCWEYPGLIVRHHDFENYPEGTVPHTTAPFDYLIVALAVVSSFFSSGPIDLAGAWISPVLAVGRRYFSLVLELAGWFPLPVARASSLCGEPDFGARNAAWPAGPSISPHRSRHSRALR